MYLGASALALIVSILKAPLFPVNDPALFEYFGWAMLHGQRLYADLLDVKLPSIFLVNLLWQRLFGENYPLHVYAGGALNAAAIALFALLLRRWKSDAWALGTFLFAVAFNLPFPEFDYTQHYAVFFIVLGLYLSACGRNLWAGAALALATTFWFPAALTAIPILLQPIARRERLLFAGGFGGTLALYLLAMLAAFGPQLGGDFIRIWSVRARNHPFNARDVLQILKYSALVRTVGVLMFLLLVAARRPIGPASRFALIWTACAFAGLLLPPNFYDHFFLPLTPALSMAIASFSLSVKDMLQRPVLAAAALAFAALAAQRTVADATTADKKTLNEVLVGEWIRSNAGSDAVVYTDEYLPELELAAHARLPGRASLLPFTQERFDWTRRPEAIVFGPDDIPPLVKQEKRIVTPNIRQSYVPICRGLTGQLIVYTLPSSVAVFHCTTTALVFGSRT